MKKTIPAQSIVICDLCKKECSDSTRRKGALLTLDAAGLDWQNCPVGQGGFKMDLCDTCCAKVEDAISKLTQP